MSAAGPAAGGDWPDWFVESRPALSDHAVRTTGGTGGGNGQELRRQELNPQMRAAGFTNTPLEYTKPCPHEIALIWTVFALVDEMPWRRTHPDGVASAA